MKTALIFGATGQDGSYLAELLLAKHYKVVGIRRRSSTPNVSNIAHLEQLQLVEGDVTDPHSIATIIGDTGPDEIYNLAAQSHVATSFEQPAYTCQVNYCGVLNILEAIRRYAPKARFYQASTSEMFGSNFNVGSFISMPPTINENGTLEEIVKYQDEQTPFAPNSPYAVAKLAAHNACRVYRDSYGMHLSCGILFNHESERRGEAFVTRKISKYIARQVFNKENHRQGMVPLKLGNLDAKRDWGHAADYVEAMWRMTQQPVADDYVVATGETHSVRDFLAASLAAADLKGEPEDYVTVDKALFRPSEVPYLLGRADKAKRVLGWAPQISFENLVARMVRNDIELERQQVYGRS